jgi:hypothetical protein
LKQKINLKRSLLNGALTLLAITILITSLSKTPPENLLFYVGGSIIAIYLPVAYIGGNLNDFQLFVEQSMLKAFIITGSILLLNYLWYSLLKNKEKSTPIQKCIFFIGIALGTLMLCSFLSNFNHVDNSQFWNFDEHKMNFLSFVFIGLLAAYYLFGTMKFDNSIQVDSSVNPK